MSHIWRWEHDLGTGAPGWRRGEATIPHAVTVRTFTAPSGSPVSARYAVDIAGTSTCCYQTQVDYYGERGHHANFETDAAGPVTVTVTVTGVSVSTAEVRPVRHGITPTVVNTSTVTFEATQADTYTLVVNGDWTNPLYVFANPYDENPPGPGDVTYYYGPGLYNNTYPDGSPLPGFWGALPLAAGESAYVHGSAYVYGKLFLGPATPNTGPTVAGVHVSGCGVVDSTTSPATMGPGRPGQVGNIAAGTIAGVALIGMRHWGCTLAESADVLLQHAKMLNYYKAGPANEKGTPDGIDIIGSSRITYDHCFIRAADDTMAFKTWKSGFGGSPPGPYWRGNVETIRVLDCVLDGGPGGNGMEIGYELFNNDTDGTTPIIDPTTGQQIAFVRDVKYQRVDVIRKTFDPAINYRCAAIGIHAADNTPVSDILYEDVNVDWYEGLDALVWVGSGSWDSYTYGQRGPISNITFRRVNFRAGNATPDEFHFEGGSAAQRVTGITFEDFYVKGVKVHAGDEPGKWTWNLTHTDTPTIT